MADAHGSLSGITLQKDLVPQTAQMSRANLHLDLNEPSGANQSFATNFGNLASRPSEDFWNLTAIGNLHLGRLASVRNGTFDPRSLRTVQLLSIVQLLINHCHQPQANWRIFGHFELQDLIHL